jgi:ammonia channel protein AmtB
VILLAGAAGAGVGWGIQSWQPGGWGDRLAGIAGGLAGALGAAQTVSGALRRGGTRVGTAALVTGAAVFVAAIAWIPVAGYVVAFALLALAVLLRRARPERYAGLRTLARDE